MMIVDSQDVVSLPFSQSSSSFPKTSAVSTSELPSGRTVHKTSSASIASSSPSSFSQSVSSIVFPSLFTPTEHSLTLTGKVAKKAITEKTVIDKKEGKESIVEKWTVSKDPFILPRFSSNDTRSDFTRKTGMKTKEHKETRDFDGTGRTTGKRRKDSGSKLTTENHHPEQFNTRNRSTSSYPSTSSSFNSKRIGKKHEEVKERRAKIDLSSENQKKIIRKEKRKQEKEEKEVKNFRTKRMTQEQNERVKEEDFENERQGMIQRRLSKNTRAN